MIARVAVTSSPPIARRTRAVFDAFGITSNDPSCTHHTMMSSSTEPSSSRRWVYCARPTPDLRQVVRERRLQPVVRVVACDPYGAEMAHVERDGVGAAGHVLGDRAGVVRERHLPATEVDHLGAEGAMLGVERRVAQVGHDPGRAGVSSMPNRSTSAA